MQSLCLLLLSVIRKSFALWVAVCPAQLVKPLRALTRCLGLKVSPLVVEGLDQHGVPASSARRCGHHLPPQVVPGAGVGLCCCAALRCPGRKPSKALGGSDQSLLFSDLLVLLVFACLWMLPAR